MLDMVEHFEPFSIEAKKNATKNFIKDRVICFDKTFGDAVGVVNTQVISISLLSLLY